MDTKSKTVLFIGILMGIGGIVVAAPTWVSLTTPAAVGGAMLAIGGTFAAAYGVDVPGRRG